MLRAEKSACEKIEFEYNQVLAQKQKLLDSEINARMAVEARCSELEQEIGSIQHLIEAAVEERTIQRKDELLAEVEMLKRQLEADQHKEMRKQREIIAIDFEF